MNFILFCFVIFIFYKDAGCNLLSRMSLQQIIFLGVAMICWAICANSNENALKRFGRNYKKYKNNKEDSENDNTESNL